MTNIKAGFWRDHGLQGLQSLQYLVPESKANVLSNTIAIALTLALPRIFILLKRSLPGLLNLYRRIVQLDTLWRLHRAFRSISDKVRTTLGRDRPRPSVEVAAFELNVTSHSEGNQERRILAGMAATLQESASAEDALSRLARRHLAMPRLKIGVNLLSSHSFQRVLENFLEDPRSVGYIILVMLLLFAIFIGLQAIAISSSFIIGSSAATIKEGACTYYVYNKPIIPGTYVPPTLGFTTPFSVYHDLEKSLTESALSYVDTCYESTKSVASCPYTLTRSIPHTVSINNECPFPAKNMCKLANSSVITMDSGFVDARILGINSPSNFEFRRRTHCSPVLDNELFVRAENISENLIEIKYRYGEHNEYQEHDGQLLLRERRHIYSSSLTLRFDTWANSPPDMYFNKIYDVRIYQTPPSQKFSFDANPYIMHGLVLPYAATSLFLVGRGGVRYYARSNDPIFPATSYIGTSWLPESENTHFGLARTVLGCVDEKYIRDRARNRNWYLLEDQLHNMPPTPNDKNETHYSDEDITALRLLGLSLRYSDTASAVKLASSNWLDAASRVLESERILSLPLDPNQWQLESRKLFNISLARMQMEIIEMTRTDRKLYENRWDGLDNLFSNMSVDPCGLIKINAEGWRNISVVGFAGMFGLALGLWIITMETGETIVLIWLYWTIAKPSSFYALGIVRSVRNLATRVFPKVIIIKFQHAFVWSKDLIERRLFGG